MPNPQNILSPITLIAHGRSGTSLTMSILRAHPDVQTCGETAPLLFGVWHSMERVKGVIRPDPELGGKDAHPARCAKAVRDVFLSTFPDDGSPRWMQKPINVPWVMSVLPGKKTLEEKAEWYWDALHRSFPGSRNITVLRHPYDVVLSASEYWGVPQSRAWNGIVEMAYLINHPRSNIDLALSHARMVEDPDPEVGRLLTHLDLSHHPRCFKAPDKIYVPMRNTNRVPKEEMQGHVARGFSRKSDWSMLDKSSFKQQDKDIIVAMWARFGETLDF